MTTEKLTADTITDAQLADLRREARLAGDEDTVALCDHAMGVYGTEVQMITVGGELDSYTREEAKAACARTINAAAAEG